MALRAGVLVRISDDRSGEGLGVERQEQDCRELAGRRGWDVVKVYRENDTSAFRRRTVRLPDGSTAQRVVRPAFRELLDDLIQGRVDTLVAYDLDRVARDPRDLEDLIDAVELRRSPAVSVTGSLDLSTDAGITMARVQVAIANKSSRDTSRRVLRAMQSLAADGRPGGGARPFGYRDDRVTPDEDEAAGIRWAHEQVESGRSLRSLAVELAVRYPHRRWDTETVRRVLTVPRNAGLREHRGRIVGAASWPGIVTPQQREHTLALLDGRTSPARLIGGPRKYLLTGLLVCGRCGGRLYPRRNADRQRFGCLPTSAGGCGGSVVVYAPAEEHIVALVLARLATLDVTEPAEDAPAAGLRAEIAEIEAEQQQLGRDLAKKRISLIVASAADAEYAERIDGLRRQITQAATAARVSDPAAVVQSWDRYGLDQRRAVLDVLLDRVVVGPARVGARFDPDRLTFVWR